MSTKNTEVKDLMRLIENTYTMLDEAEGYLQKAKTAGIFDILGGELITSIYKHNKIDKAKELFHAIRSNLSSISYKVSQLEENHLFHAPDPTESLDLSTGLSTMDIVFDNIISDFMVQEKINDSINQLGIIRNNLHTLMNKLRTLP